MEFKISPLLIAPAGSSRYGYLEGSRDLDIMVLWEGEDKCVCDEDPVTDYFFTSPEGLHNKWGHPLLMGNITGECTGNKKLVAFLWEHRREIFYAAPASTAIYGLDYISVGERYKHASPIKAGLRTAMILSHMAKGAEDPTILSEEEKSVLLRARDGGVPIEERAEIYRRTISPENINRLLKMPDHPTIKNEFFTLLEEVISSC